MTREAASRAAWQLALVALLGACGDLYGDVVTRAAAGASGAGGRGPAGAGGTAGVSAGATGGGGTGASGGAAGGSECATSQDCTSGETRVCDPVSLRCVECLTEGHCESDEGCNPIILECANACDASTPCLESDDPICDMALGVCVECQVSTDCDDGQVCGNTRCEG